MVKFYSSLMRISALSLLILLGCMAVFQQQAQAQCNNGSAFGSVAAPAGATAVTISTCSFQSEYSTITGVVAGNRYVVTGSAVGTFITMRFSTSGGQFVAAGETPLQFTAPCAGTYYAHWNTNSACGTASTCVTTTIACSSCGATASQCNNASVFGTATAPTVLNTTVNFSTCSFQSEYSTLNTVAAGKIYRLTASAVGTFITVRQGTSDGAVIASGVTPLTFTSTVAGTYYPHWNTNSACGTASSCVTTSVTYVGDSPCAGPFGCLTAVNGLWPSATFTPTCTGAAQSITTCGFGSEYSNVNVVSGNSYTFSSSVTTDYITISDAAGVTILAGGTTPVTWVATTTGTVRFYTHTDLATCGAQSVCRDKSVACTVQVPGCLTFTYSSPYPSATFTPTCTGAAQAITTCAYASEYSNVNVISGNSYTFSSSAAYFITISNAGGTTVLASGLTPVTWVSNTTGVVRFYTHTDLATCGALSGCTTRSVACTVTLPGCLTAIYSSPYPAGTFTPTCPGGAQEITSCGFASEYSNVNVTSGNVYTFTSSVATDFITISDATGTTVLASGTTPVSWTANTTGVVRFYTHTNSACGSAGACRNKYVSCATNPDFCAGAIPITCGTPVSGTTVGTTTDPGLGTCGTTLDTAPGVWYSLAGFNGEVTLSLCGSGYDTKIGVFTGSCGALTCVTGNDDFCSLQSQVTFPSSAGNTYYILVTGFSTNTGAFTLNSTCTTCAAPTGVTVSPITTTTATVNWNCVGCTGTFIVEYGPSASFTTPGTGAAAGVGGTVVTSAGSPAVLNGLTAGTQYRVFVRQDCSGTFSNNTTGVLFSTPPANDNVCAAIPLVLGVNPPYTNAGATTEAGEPVPPATGCSVQNGWCLSTISNSVWFTVVGPPSGKVTISSTGFDNQLALYAATSCTAVTSGAATLLGANDDFNGLGASVNNVCVTPGVTYYVQMDGYATGTGISTITVIEIPNTAPSIAGCPANITSCANFATWTVPTASDPDGCGAPTLTSTHNPGFAFPNGLTTVTYTATDHAGATAVCTFTVNVAKITVTFNTTNVSCNGGSNGSATVIPVGGTGHTYVWSNGQTSATATGLAAGAYFVTTSNAQGCSLVSLVNISQPPALNCNASSTNVACNGDATGTASASASGGVGPYTYNWSNGATGANISGLVAGTYTVSVSDANGCICTKTVTVSEPPAIQIVSAEVIVDGSGGTFYSVYEIVVAGGTLPYDITFTVTGGFADYTITYSLVDTDNNGSLDSPGATINVTYQSSAIWTLTLDDANDCGEDLVFTNAAGSPILSIASAIVTADNGTSTGAIALTIAGGTPACPGYSYAWSGPSNWPGIGTTSTISGLPSGWYIVVVTDCSGEETYGWFWVPKQSRGRGKLADGQAITVYPNPVNAQTTIEFSVEQTTKATVAVHSIDGKQVAQLYSGTAEAGELYTLPYDVAHLPNGMYMVTLTGDNGFVQHFKLSVLH